MKKTIIAGIAGATIAGGALGFAAPAFAEPNCTFFNPDQSGDVAISAQGVCGVPDLVGTFSNLQENLTNDFSPSVAAGNLQDNFSTSNAAKNLQDNFDPAKAAENLNNSITKGVGSDG